MSRLRLTMARESKRMEIWYRLPERDSPSWVKVLGPLLFSLAGHITQRSQVQILSPLQMRSRSEKPFSGRSEGGFFVAVGHVPDVGRMGIAERWDRVPVALR